MADESNKTIELDALKEDIQKLQSDLKDMLHNLSTQGKEKLEESRKKLQAAMKSLKGQTEKKFDEVYDTLSEQSREAVEKGRKANRRKAAHRCIRRFHCRNSIWQINRSEVNNGTVDRFRQYRRRCLAPSG